jgi:hypothetical protein
VRQHARERTRASFDDVADVLGSKPWRRRRTIRRLARWGLRGIDHDLELVDDD